MKIRHYHSTCKYQAKLIKEGIVALSPHTKFQGKSGGGRVQQPHRHQFVIIKHPYWQYYCKVEIMATCFSGLWGSHMLQSIVSENTDTPIQNIRWERLNTHPSDIEVYSITPNKCVKLLNWEVSQFPDSLDVYDAPWATNFSCLCYTSLPQVELWHDID